MRLTPLVLAGALVLGGAGGVWLYYGRSAGVTGWLADADYLQERAERALERGTAGDRARAVALLRRALARDPASPYRWCTLGEALAEGGDAEAAGACFRRAVELGGNIPPVRMRAANFYFGQGRVHEALAETRRILELVREYDAAIFVTYERMGVPLSQAMGEGLPEEREARVSFFRHLLASGTPAEAGAGWEMLERSGACDAKLSADYTAFLLRWKSYEDARRIWAQGMDGAGCGFPAPNRVYNGGFERTPAKGGLDWTIAAVEGVTAEREREPHGGAWSLALRFHTERNIDYRQVTEAVVAEPGRYRFRAWIRAEGITTDEGVRFQVADAEAPRRLEWTSEGVTGSCDWKEIAATLTVPPGSRLLRVGVARRPSLKFDNKIQGRVWIDDVSLEATASCPRSPRSTTISKPRHSPGFPALSPKAAFSDQVSGPDFRAE